MFVADLAAALSSTNQLSNFLTTYGDVPNLINVGGTTFGLSRYLRNKLRFMLGIDDGSVSMAFYDQSKKMQEMYLII